MYPQLLGVIRLNKLHEELEILAKRLHKGKKKNVDNSAGEERGRLTAGRNINSYNLYGESFSSI